MWPPIDHMKTTVSKMSESCTEACHAAGEKLISDKSHQEECTSHQNTGNIKISTRLKYRAAYIIRYRMRPNCMMERTDIHIHIVYAPTVKFRVATHHQNPSQLFLILVTMALITFASRACFPLSSSGRPVQN